MIHILDAQTDELRGVLDNKGDRVYWDDSHTQGLDGYNVLQFVTFADIPESALLTKRGRLLVKSEFDYYQEFIIFESIADTSRDLEVVATGSEVDLDKQTIIEPARHESKTLQYYVETATKGTEWKVGTVEYAGSRTITFEKFLGGYEFLREIQKTFDVELRFRIETNGNAITGRYVDVVRRLGEDNGKEITYGKDLVGVERKVYSERIATAVFAIGPEREDGERLTVTATDNDAFQRWNRNGAHLIAIHEVESDDENMTVERLTTLAEMELRKRIDSVTEYTVTAETIEHLFPHERVRLGDTVRVIDPEFSPPLYAEARVIEVERSLDNSVPKVMTIGSVVEYNEDEVRAAFRDLQQQYGTAIVRRPDAPTGKYNVIWIDSSGKIDVPHVWNGEDWVKFAPTSPEDIGAVSDEEAQAIAEIENIRTIRRLLANNQTNLETEFGTIDDNDLLVGTWIHDNLVASRTASVDKTAETLNAIDDILLDNNVSPAERTRLITLIDETEAAHIDYNAHLSKAHEFIASEQARIAEERAALAEKAAQDADEKAQSALDDLVYKVDKSTYDTMVEDITGRIADKADSSYVSEVIARLDGEIDGIDTDITGINAALGTLNTDVDNLKTDVDSIETNLGTVTGDVESLGTDVTGLRTDVDALTTDYTTISDAVGGLESDVTGLESNVGTLLTDVGNLKTLKADAARVETLEGTVETHGTTIAANAEAIALKADKSIIDPNTGLETDMASLVAMNASAIALKVDRDVYDTLAGTVESHGTSIEANANAIALKADASTVNALGETVESHSASIAANAEAIALKADSEIVDPNTGRTTTLSALLALTAEGLTAKADSEIVDPNTGAVTTLGTLLTQTAEGMSAKADKSVVDDIAGTVTSHGTSIAANAEAIALKADSERVNTLEGTVETHGTSISANARAIELKADKSVVDDIAGTVESHGTSITANANAIKLKADASRVNTLEGTVTEMETTLTLTAEGLAAKADQTTVDALEGTVTTHGTSIEANTKAIGLKADKSVVDDIAGTVETHGTSISANAEAIALKADKSVVDTLSGTVESHGTSITANANSIALKADKSVVDDLGRTVESHGTSITANAEAIALKAEKSDVDTLSGTVSEMETTLSVTAEGLKSKAEVSYVDRKDKIIDSDGGTIKTFKDVLNRQWSGASIVGALVIRTPITGRQMAHIHMTGYNYRTNKSVIDLDVSFYNYTNSFLQHGFVSKGSYDITQVRLARDVDGSVVIIIGDVDTVWAYPHILVDKAAFGYTLAPDSYADGWTASIETELSADWTVMTNLGGQDYGSTLKTHSTEITQTAEALQTKADNSIVDPVTGNTTTVGTLLRQTAQGLSTKAESQTVNELTGEVSAQRTLLDQTAEAVSLKADAATVNTLTGTVESHGTSITANATAIALKADKSVVDDLAGTVESHGTSITANANAIKLKADASRVSTLEGTVSQHGTAITANADAIALKASSESVTQLGDRVDGVEDNVASSEVRLADVELRLDDSAIISTVTNSTQFETMFNQKADAEDLAGYASADAVDNLMEQVTQLGDEVNGIATREFVTSTELEQRDLSLIATISASGGVNLLRNSVGLAGLEYWTVTGNGTVSPTGSTELASMGYHSGFLIETTGTTGPTKLTQSVGVLAGKTYTLSLALRNITATGDVTVQIVDDESGTVLGTAPVYSSVGAGDYGQVSVTVENVPSNQLRVEVVVPAGKNAIVTALMMNIGSVAFSWTNAVGELYNTTIKMDLNGMRVSRYDDDGTEVGFTVMTPERFAGYYNENGFIDETIGSDDEVFRVDRDEFVMKKATVSSEITMGTLKALNIDTPDRRGWAFVPN